MNGRQPGSTYNTNSVFLNVDTLNVWMGGLGRRTDLKTLSIVSLTDNMMHVTFDNSIRRGVRANETLFR